jgi:hypothetical protein
LLRVVSAFVEAAEAKAAVVESCIPLDYKIPTHLGAYDFVEVCTHESALSSDGASAPDLEDVCFLLQRNSDARRSEQGRASLPAREAIGKRCRDSGF